VRGSFIENRERIISEGSVFSFFWKPIMNTCCNEWRNSRFWMGVHEREKKKIGTYFWGTKEGVGLEAPALRQAQGQALREEKANVSYPSHSA
jgi:hypothetical protein